MARKLKIETDRFEIQEEGKRGGHANYIPVLKGKELEEEGGVTEISTNNLRKVAKIYGKPLAIEMVSSIDGEYHFLFHFSGPDYRPFVYLATGYSIGYAGTGPTGLAEIMAEFRFGEFESVRADIIRGEWQAGIVAVNGGLIRHLGMMITADEGTYENVL
jgi:hypothetical protein